MTINQIPNYDPRRNPADYSDGFFDSLPEDQQQFVIDAIPQYIDTYVPCCGLQAVTHGCRPMVLIQGMASYWIRDVMGLEVDPDAMFYPEEAELQAAAFVAAGVDKVCDAITLKWDSIKDDDKELLKHDQRVNAHLNAIEGDEPDELTIDDVRESMEAGVRPPVEEANTQPAPPQSLEDLLAQMDAIFASDEFDDED